MNDADLILLEKKYYNIIFNVLQENLGRIITDICSQKRFFGLATASRTNQIEDKAENIIENIINSNLSWDVCDLPISSDLCYSCGDAIIHIDVKTTKDTDPDSPSNINRICVEAAQTSYSYGTTFNTPVTTISGFTSAEWAPKLKLYEQHEDFGKVPNLTYFIRIIHSDNNLVEQIGFFSAPNGQLAPTMGGASILDSGKTYSPAARYRIVGTTILKNNNIRFKINDIIGLAGNNWRYKILYTRDNS